MVRVEKVSMRLSFQNAIKQYEILNTPSEPAFDELTRLASQICETPIALVSLADDQRVWFKAKVGLNVQSIPINPSMCAIAMQSAEPLMVADLLSNESFKESACAKMDPPIRFYCGVALRDPTGIPIGTLCVLDYKPRSLSAGQIGSLVTLSHQVMTLFELRKSIIETRLNLADLEAKVLEQDAQLFRASQLATIGELSAGIAHEINNPLAIIAGSINVLLEQSVDTQTLDPSTLQKPFNRMLKAALRASDIIHSLKALSRDSRKDPLDAVDLGVAVGEAISLVQEKFKLKDIKIQNHVTESVFALGRMSQILQVLTNLLGNSADAIEKLQDRWVKIFAEVHLEKIRIHVVDSGAGIPEEVRAKLMTPFFTTKEAGRGTGLGLSISKRLCELQNGKLLIDHLAANTTFVVELPRANKKLAS